MKENGIKRRHFLRNSALGIIGAGVLRATDGNSVAQETQETTKNETGLAIKEYRTLGRTEFKVSDISCGSPTNVSVLNTLLDMGVNYIDTAERYNNGYSEIAVGEAIKNRDRKTLFITTKLTLSASDSKQTILNRSRQCLERLNTQYIDCMMIHSPETSIMAKSEAFHAAMKQLKAEGKVRFTGISHHGPLWEKKYETMEQLLAAAVSDNLFDVVLLVYNFVQKEQAEHIIKICKEKNIGVLAMKANPVAMYTKYKYLTDNDLKNGKTLSEEALKNLEYFKQSADQAEVFIGENNLTNLDQIRSAAIKYVLANPMVASVCCTINNFEELEAFLKVSGERLQANEQQKLELYRKVCKPFYCRHACGLCQSTCPHSVAINTIMRYNHYFMAQGREKYAMQKYAALTSNNATPCFTCHGVCQTACPYGVQIHGLLTTAHQQLSLA